MTSQEHEIYERTSLLMDAEIPLEKAVEMVIAKYLNNYKSSLEYSKEVVLEMLKTREKRRKSSLIDTSK